MRWRDPGVPEQLQQDSEKSVLSNDRSNAFSRYAVSAFTMRDGHSSCCSLEYGNNAYEQVSTMGLHLPLPSLCIT